MSQAFLPDRWKELAPLLDAALELEPAERSAFLDRVGAEDAELRAELETLLAECARPDGLFATGAVERFGALLAETPGQLPEMVAGRYRVEREIGAGGMATVYLARDVKHDREVALKVLRTDLSAAIGAERFLTEIRITAKLDHPHILTLIDSGSADGLLFYVMPYVRGESLRAKLARECQLSLEDALSITQQVAAALDYAHAQGVVHRDIKPENILLHEGEAVLADFGIALAVAEAGGPRLTEAGRSLGTPQYMSPEQAAGDRTLDARSDIYSLAAVLYEMIAGEPPVTGATKQAIIAKLLAERPTRLRVVRDTVPEGVDRAVLKALSKVPADRFATAGAFVRAFDAGVATDADVAPPRRFNARILSAFAVVAVAALGAWLARGKITGGHDAGVALKGFRQITSNGHVTLPTISPDGKTLAYRTTTCSPTRCVYGIELYDVVSRESRQLLDSASAILTIEWSPDGRSLLFRGTVNEHLGTYRVLALSGIPRPVPYGATFSARGDSLLIPRGGVLDKDTPMMLVSGLDGIVRDSVRIANLGDHIAFIRAVPGSKWIVVGVVPHPSKPPPTGLVAHVIGRDGREVDRIVIGLRGSRNVESHASSDALWVSPGGEGWPKRAVLRIPLDAATGHFLGAIDTLSTGVHTGFGVTADGRDLVVDEASSAFDLWALDVSNAIRGMFPQTPLLHSTAALSVRLSPDGKRVLVAHDAGKTVDERLAWSTIPFDGPPGAEKSLAFSERTTEAFWSDSATVTTRSVTKSGNRLAQVDVETGNVRDTLTIPASYPRNFAHLRDGGWFWVKGQRPELNLQLPGDTTPRRIPLPAQYTVVDAADISHDGRFVAFTGPNAAGSVSVSVMSLIDRTVTDWFTIDAGVDVSWVNGSLLLYVADTPETISLYRLSGPGPAEKIGTIPRPVFSMSVSHDLKRAAIVVHDDRADAWMSRVRP